MVLDLAFGKRLYDWFGSHERIYRVVRWVACLGRVNYLQRQTIAALAVQPGDTVLDLACGAGFNLPYLQACVGPEGKIVALDYSEGMLAAAQRKAQRHGWKNVNFVKADATQMDMEANILDGAICTFGLSAMPGELGALQRVAKAMKPGARFVAFDAKPFTGWGSVMNPISQPLFKYSTNWDYRKDAVASLRSVFSVLEVQEHNSGCNYIAVGRKS
jgi:demethylmenaquinone methyltransferase/2-methoxy-6-polyprenyl-1,4-benzoquinol methylase